MKLTLPILLAGALTASFAASADDVVQINGAATGISPDGKYVVGTKSPYAASRYTSFLYSTADDKLEWLTDGDNYFKSHLEGGWFAAINNAGMKAGTIRNPDMRLHNEVGPYYAPGGSKNAPTPCNFSDDEEGLAVSSAAVWRNDKVYLLGCGPYIIDDFIDFTDGSQGIAISADGNVVLGNIYSNWSAVEACCWEYDADSDAYEYRALAIPAGAMITIVTSCSQTGFPAIGSISVPSSDGTGFTKTVLWKSALECEVIEVPEEDGMEGIYPNVISTDGRYMTLSVAGKFPRLYLYDIENGTLEKINLPGDTTGVVALTMTDDANMILKMSDNTFTYELYYYDRSSTAIVPLAEYLTDILGDYDIFSRISSGVVMAATGDGKNIVLKQSQTDSDSWLISMDNPQLQVCPAPTAIDIYHTSPTSIEIVFEGIPSLPRGCELTGYEVYVNNSLVQTFDASTTGGKFTLPLDNYNIGNRHQAYINTLYKKDGELKSSANSQTASVFVSSNTELLETVNFDDAVGDAQGNFGWDNDGWSSKMNYGIPGEFINWYITGGDFENRTPCISAVAASTEPWSTLFESHYMDATGAKDFFIDFRYIIRSVNGNDQDFSTDYLDVEVSTDGREWKKAGSISASETAFYQWQSFHLDLGKDMAGKVFRLRLNAHGEGLGQLMWMVDDIIIDDDLYGDEVAGLRSFASKEEVKLMWNNAYGLHDLSYLDNSGILWDFNVGNQGQPLISAIELTDDQIRPFIGEYISGVSSFLFDDPDIYQAAPTKAEAIVYVDGKEVARAKIDSEFNTVGESMAWLDTPVAIEAGKTYRIAVRISDYAYDQAPLYYQASSTSKPGYSDIFSEDDGKTWLSVCDSEAMDYNVNPNGYCVWPIRAHISDGAVTPSDPSELLYYDLFCNGVKINNGAIYEPHPWMIVNYPYAGTYTVQAHYKGGYISPMSEPLVVNEASGVQNVNFTLSVTGGKGSISVTGEFNRVTLYDMSGRVVAYTSNNVISALPAGVYILNAETSAGIETYKVIVK